MGRTIFTTLFAVIALAAAASALDVGVGAFYAPGRVFGGAAEIKELNPGGFKGRVSLGVYDNIDLAFGLGYNDFAYREDAITIPEVDPVLSIPMFVTTLGAYYTLPVRPLRPYVGGGAAIARESAEGYSHSTTDWYGGLYVEGGARYFLINRLAVEAGPRYTLLFDKPVVYYDGWDVHDFVRSEDRSQLIELLVGINYYF
ncbi:MAG: outer membrane beta-barrel protein [candidate division Zixibacteria bacterium]|nr:outer membrane beta-barrel protein [candidate division Zixibacteria bacterium]